MKRQISNQLIQVPTESPVATSEADILLDILQSTRSRFQAALPNLAIHAIPPSLQENGISPLATYIYNLP